MIRIDFKKRTDEPMEIHGFAKTTLLDYPKHVAATIFFGGCNFRCPFCHNADLVLNPGQVPVIAQEEVLAYLKKRQGILEGVCITGGEPTLQPDLETLIRKIRDLGYLVKLDTNGYRPEILSDLLEKNLLDYVAMDIKNSKEKYQLTVAKPNFDLSKIEESVNILMTGTVAYEFRTTVVKQLHTPEDMEKIGQWIAGCQGYYLQNYVASDKVISPGFTACDTKELLHMQAILQPYIPNTQLRGVDNLS